MRVFTQFAYIYFGNILVLYKSVYLRMLTFFSSWYLNVLTEFQKCSLYKLIIIICNYRQNIIRILIQSEIVQTLSHRPFTLSIYRSTSKEEEGISSIR